MAGLTVMVGLALLLAGSTPCSAQTTLTLGDAAQADNLGVFAGAGKFTNLGSLTIKSGGSRGNFGLGPVPGASFLNIGSAAYNQEFKNVSTASLATAASQASSLAQNGTLSNGTLSNGILSKGTISGPSSASLVVYDVKGINLTGANTLTINASSSQTVVVNVSGNVNLNGLGAVLLSGGVTANHVLFNVGGTITTLGSTTLNGTFLDLVHSISLAGTTKLTGALVGDGGINTAGVTTINASFFADPPIATAPELPTIAVAGMAFLLLIGKTGFDHLRRRPARGPSLTRR